jgi:hypothetical protein
MILAYAAARLADLGISAEVDDHGQAVFYPPEGYGFDIDPDTGSLVLTESEHTTHQTRGKVST